MDLYRVASQVPEFSGMFSCAEKILLTVQDTLNDTPISEDMRQVLLGQLDIVSNSLSMIEQVALHVNQFVGLYFQQLRATAVFLYGEVDTAYLRYEITVLQEGTARLKEAIDSGHSGAVADRSREIGGQMQKILHQFCPPLQDRRSLVVARLMVEQGEGYLRGESISELPMNEWNLLETESVLEEIGLYLMTNNRKELRALIRKLRPLQKKLISAYLEPRNLLEGMLQSVESPAVIQAS